MTMFFLGGFMIKNRLTQLIYRIIYCVILSFGVLFSLGIWTDKSFNTDFYAYYTNLSNYLCLGVMIAVTVNTVRQLKNNQNHGTTDYLENTKFMCSILILVTFLVYNILLAKDNSAFEYFTSLSNLTLHLVGPILFILDHILFDSRCSVKWYMPLVSFVPPLGYVGFVFIRAAIIGNNPDIMKYPYFFLNPEEVGIGGVFMWIFILLAVFAILGYILWILNHLIKENGKLKIYPKNDYSLKNKTNQIEIDVK